MTGAGNHLSFGLVASGDPESTAALEDLPIDSLWVGGHVSSPRPTGEAMMALARLSALTTRVKIGTAILLLPLYPPAIVAKQIADLDRASGGRVVLGIGVGGEYPQEFEACGVALEQRGPRTDEAIPLLRRLWGGEELTHDGDFYPMAGVRVHPAPAQVGGPPIVVAGRKPPAMRRAAVLGDGWMPYLYSPTRYAASVRRIREEADRHNRDLDNFGWYAYVFTNVNPDGDTARADAARFLGSTYNQDFRPMIERVGAAGTVEEVRGRLAEFVDAGARRFILAPAAPVDARHAVVQRLMGEVIPYL